MNLMNLKRHNHRFKDIMQFLVLVSLVIFCLIVLVLVYRKTDTTFTNNINDVGLSLDESETTSSEVKIYDVGIIRFANAEHVEVTIEKNTISVAKITAFANMEISYNAEEDFVVKNGIDEDILIFDTAVKKTIITIEVRNLTTDKISSKKVGVTFEEKD